MVTVAEMLEQLEDLVESGMGECEVRLATQPDFHPFEWSLSCASTLVGDSDDELPVFYLAQGRQLGHLSEDAHQVLRDLEWGEEAW